MSMIIYFSKKNRINLKTLSTDLGLRKKKNQSIILKIKMKLEEYIYKKGLYH